MKKLILIVCIVTLATTSWGQVEVTMTSTLDNTIFSESSDLSNGSGEHFYAGNTRLGDTRRGLIQFDIASMVPAGSFIDSVALSLHVSLAPNISTDHEFSLHRLLTAWGEGPSDAGQPGGQGTEALAGDATWNSSILGQSEWTNAGGDFNDTASATIDIPAVRNRVATWSTAEMVNDVQDWLNDSSTNFGWIIIGDENDTQSARRFDSREEQDESLRPSLYIRYTMAVSNQNNLGLNNIEAYPNPAKDFITLNLELANAQDVNIKLVNLIGKTVQQVDVPSGNTFLEHTFDVKSLTPGLYFIRVNTKEGMTTRKIVIER